MEAGMSSTGIAKERSTLQAPNYRSLRLVLAGAAILLCLFGSFASLRATIKILTQQQPSTGIDAFFDYPAWGVLHFLPGLLFMTLVPLQLWPRLRNRHRVYHRWSGRILVATGVVLGLSGVTFPFLMPERPFSERVAMTTFFAFFLFFLLKAFAAARRRDFARHREWMIRWFAAGLAITTQRVLLPVFAVAIGVNDMRGFWEIFVTAAWLASVIQILIAEWWVSTTRRAELGVKAA
jgi:uncharacterized membrane protein